MTDKQCITFTNDLLKSFIIYKTGKIEITDKLGKKHIIDGYLAKCVIYVVEYIYSQIEGTPLYFQREELKRAKLEGVRLGLEAAYKEVSENQKAFSKETYAVGQPDASFRERFACGVCLDDIRALDPQAIINESE